MPTSRKNKERTKQVNNYKTKHKKMNQEQQQNVGQEMPPVRNVPTWGQNAKIEVTGFEWEAIQNGLSHIQLAQQAAQSIMSRNIVNGVIKMDFEKLNPTTSQYEAMTPEEKAPYAAEFEEMINSFKNQVKEKATATPQIAEYEGVHVDSPVLNSTDEVVDIASDDIQQEVPEQENPPVQEAKVITMGKREAKK